MIDGLQSNVQPPMILSLLLRVFVSGLPPYPHTPVPPYTGLLMDNPDSLRFVADNMLGSLARKLRLLGIDTAYVSDADNSELKYLVRFQSRILLTRDVNLSKNLGELSWLVTGKDAREEFLSIAERIKPFSDQFEPFSRCLDCNDLLLPMGPSDAEGRVPPFIYQSKKTFYGCPSCGKIFWEGTHSDRMGEEVSWMRGVLEKGEDLVPSERNGETEKR